MLTRYSTVILGAGPAGTGLLVCAAQRGRLGRLLDGGLAVVERTDRMGSGTLGRYELNSDSLATSFVECLEPAPARRLFEELAGLPVSRELIRRRDRHVPLSRVAQFLGRVGEVIRREIEQHPGCDYLPRTAARRVALRDDGLLEIELEAAGNGGESRRILARSVVLALGGRQDIDAVLDETFAGLRLRKVAERVLLTDPLLSHGGVRRLVERWSAGGRRIVIVGGSHSAFSTAWALTERLPAGWLAESDIVVLHRDRLRVFYTTPHEALAEDYTDFTDEDICPRTGRVHRLGGLRGDGRELWRRITGRAGPAETRVRIERLPAEAPAVARVRRTIESADLVIPAFGYRPRTIPLYDAAGRRLRLHADVGGTLVGKTSRVLLENGRSLPQVFGIGMASGYRPAGEPSFRGQTNGVWLYHNVHGEPVLDGIASVARGRGETSMVDD